MGAMADGLPHAHPKHPNDLTPRPPPSTNRQAISQPSRYAFLNHSTVTVHQNLPPSVDDKPLARQRRRRTSPEDQTVLEAAYNQDPKPDKSARLEIVKQVSLGEKEVQIWFQNRRQTSRRKSRPLLPHEIAQYQLARGGVNAQFSPSDLISNSSQEDGVHASGDGSVDLVPQDDMRASLSNELATETTAAMSSSPTLSIPGASIAKPDLNHSAFTATKTTTANPTNHLRHPIGRHGRVVYKEGFQHLRRSQSFSKPSSPPMHLPQAESAARLKKSSSCIRLSLAGDGNAQIVTKDSTSPSLPHPPQTLLSSQHHGGAHQLSNFSNTLGTIPLMKPLQRASSGRSRDSRVWEFWCDKDARNELEEKAEQDASGSAAGAIGLLRSASGRSILGAIPSKRALSRQSISSKRSKVEMAVPKLHKSSTALGRLEGMPTLTSHAYAEPPAKLKSTESAFSIHIPGNESDKENWSPSIAISLDGQSERSSHYEGPLKAAESAKVATRDWARHSSVGGVKRHRHSVSTGEDNSSEDPEVTAFMSSARKRSSVSGDEELDCVQGLLSLSQGNWR